MLTSGNHAPLRLGPSGALLLHHRPRPGRLDLHLEGNLAIPRLHRLQLDGGEGGTGFEGGALHWSMARGVGVHAPRWDPVKMFARRLRGALARAWGVGRKKVADGHPFLDDLARAKAHLALAVDGLLLGLEPWALAQARRFAPSIRWAVYAALVGDGTRRVAQLSDAAPGALVFALHHARIGDAPSRAAAAAFREAVRAGVPLKRALQPLLEDWVGLGARSPRFRTHPPFESGCDDAAGPPRFPCAPSPFVGARHPSALLAEEAPAGQARRCREQLLLLRRAPHAAAAHVAWLPPPIAWIPDDLPASPLGRRRWFRVMKGSPECTAGWLPAMDRGVQAAAVRWLSRHAATFQESDAGACVWPEALMAHVHLRGERLAPSLSVATVAGRVELSHLYLELLPDYGPELAFALAQDLRRNQRRAHLFDLAPLDDGTLDTPLPGRLPATTRPGLSAEPLATPRRIWAEGASMQHCVGARVQAARAGAQLFHLELDGTKLTAQLNPDGRGGWQLKELAGEHNRRPTAAERQRVHAWLRDLPAHPALGGQPTSATAAPTHAAGDCHHP